MYPGGISASPARLTLGGQRPGRARPSPPAGKGSGSWAHLRACEPARRQVAGQAPSHDASPQQGRARRRGSGLSGLRGSQGGRERTALRGGRGGLDQRHEARAQDAAGTLRRPPPRCSGRGAGPAGGGRRGVTGSRASRRTARVPSTLPTHIEYTACGRRSPPAPLGLAGSPACGCVMSSLTWGTGVHPSGPDLATAWMGGEPARPSPSLQPVSS